MCRIEPLSVTLEINKIKKPLYEDTFDLIEEFLSDSLFDEWKAFVQTENDFFNKVKFYHFFIQSLFIENLYYRSKSGVLSVK